VPVPLVVLLVGLAGVALIAALSAFRGDRVEPDETGPLDPERTERWIVRNAPSRLRPALRHADRRVVGGAAVAVSFVAVLLSAVVVGWIFETVDTTDGFAQWDESVAEWGATNASDTSTRVLDLLTHLGGTLWLLVIMVVIGVVDYVRNRNLNVLLYLVVIGVGIVLINNGLKLIVDRPRPDIARLSGWSGTSFPSGHSAAAAACWAGIAMVVTRHMTRGWRIAATAVAAGLAVTVAATRVLLGVHWLTDVIAGVIVGWTWFFLVTIAFGGRLVRLGEPAERAASGRETADTYQLEHS
jgi:membrane-associated phospholipid phosphatase